MKLQNQVMLDLETLSTRPNAYIVSIGARKFSYNGLGEAFYAVIRMEEYEGNDFHVDPKTVGWWMGKSDHARQVFADKSACFPLISALKQFRGFLSGCEGLWGNGADFDNVILQNAYRTFGIHDPWDFRLNRCFRTMKALYGDKVALPPHEGAHNAVNDATHQALHMINMLSHSIVKEGLCPVPKLPACR